MDTRPAPNRVTTGDGLVFYLGQQGHVNMVLYDTAHIRTKRQKWVPHWPSASWRDIWPLHYYGDDILF